jgi:uncharacterized protein
MAHGDRHSRVTETITLAALPAPLSWLLRPESWQVDANALTIRAAGGTDLFTDPAGEAHHANAPALLTTLTGDYTLSARVSLTLESDFDAAVLLLHTDAEHWAKLCLERSPQGEPTIVSVVTRGVSDDCNAFTVDADADVELRISRLGPAFAFHARTRQDPWRLIRYFALDGDPRVGFLAQSPTGKGVTARFDRITHTPTRLAELRNGE